MNALNIAEVWVNKSTTRKDRCVNRRNFVNSEPREEFAEKHLFCSLVKEKQKKTSRNVSISYRNVQAFSHCLLHGTCVFDNTSHVWPMLARDGSDASHFWKYSWGVEKAESTYTLRTGPRTVHYHSCQTMKIPECTVSMQVLQVCNRKHKQKEALCMGTLK